MVVRGRNVLGKHIWTAQEHEALRVMYARGDSARAIGDYFGVTERAVLGQALKLQIRHKSRTLSLAERFAKYVVPEPNSGCLLWLGTLTSTGRPSISVYPKTISGARAALQLAGIEIPPGALVLHRCDNPICVNHAHLYFGDYQDNQRDARGRGLPGSRIPLDECVNGHALTGDNLIVLAGGQRVCRVCRNRHARELRARRRAAL